MSDDKNPARVARIAELAADYRKIEEQIAELISQNQPPSPQDATLIGFALLKRIQVESQQLLTRPFSLSPSAPQGDANAQRVALQRIVLDASARRFVAQKLYVQAVQAARWNAMRRPSLRSGDVVLRAMDQSLRNELNFITDSRVFRQLMAVDVERGSWTEEDPTLERILAYNSTTQT